MKLNRIFGAAVTVAAMSACTAFLAASPATAQSKPTIEKGLEHFQGRWVWQGALKTKNDPKNTSFIQFTDADRIVYCYKTYCSEVNIHRDAGDGFTFTTNGKNNFAMVGTPDGKLTGRFWNDFTSDANPPDAIVTFTLRSGH